MFAELEISTHVRDNQTYYMATGGTPVGKSEVFTLNTVIFLSPPTQMKAGTHTTHLYCLLPLKEGNPR